MASSFPVLHKMFQVLEYLKVLMGHWNIMGSTSKSFYFLYEWGTILLEKLLHYVRKLVPFAKSK